MNAPRSYRSVLVVFMLIAGHSLSFAQDALKRPTIHVDKPVNMAKPVLQQADAIAGAEAEIRREFERDIALARATGDTGKHIAAHLNAARWYVQREQLPGARKYFLRAMSVARAADNKIYLPKTLRAISLIYVSSGDEQARALSRRYAEHAFVTSESIGDGADIAKSHYQLGVVALASSDTDTARDHFAKAFNYQSAQRDEFGAGRSLAMIAAALERDSRNPNWSFFNRDEPRYRNVPVVRRAIDMYKDALRRHREAGDDISLGRSLHNVGAIHKNLGENEKAKGYFEQAVKIIQETQGDDAAQRVVCRVGVPFERSDGEDVLCPTSSMGTVSLMSEEFDADLFADEVDGSGDVDSSEGVNSDEEGTSGSENADEVDE